MTSTTPRAARAFAAAAVLLGFVAGAPALAQSSDTIFSAGFDALAAPSAVPATLGFSNVTRQVLDSNHDSAYRFDTVWNDFNADGCPDIFVFGHEDQATSQLWINRCDGSHTFTWVSNDAVHYYIPQPTTPRGSGWITLLDFNGDGDQDFFLRDAGEMGARYVNDTMGAHVPYFSGKEDGCIHGCAFADIDGDNTIDLIHNDGQITGMLDGQPVVPGLGRTDTFIPMDVDGDGWTDLLEPQAGGYWHNVHGQLQWQAAANLGGRPMLHVVADFDNNGTLDLFTFNGSSEINGGVHLYRNDGQGHFTDVTTGSGLAALPFNSYWTSYGNAVAADFDNDGLPGLLVAGASYAPSVSVVRNLGGMKFKLADVDLGQAGGGSDAFKSRASVADFDNDGRLDVLKTQVDTNVGVWRNTTARGLHWMNVRVRGQGLNADGVGADIKWYRHGTSTLLAHVWLQANDQHPQTWPHVGLGSADRVDLVVSYPGGGPVVRFDNLAVDQSVVLYPTGCLLQQWQPGNGWPMSAPATCR
ncbi:MAG TPA: VCBS repeat-containing protein [Rhodanobacteraceae bacterium]|nr:VCBS repeat-containing protein [Rhodanobacteraceae bacterium]